MEPSPYTYPQPVFIVAAYGSDGTPDAMNAAWGGISDTTELSLCLSAGHKTTKNILERKAITVSMAECDYLGVVSANHVPDKLVRAGFHTTKIEFVDAPLIDELAMAVECRLVSYDSQTGHLVGGIVNVSVDESVLTPGDKADAAKLAPITFDPINSAYHKLGEQVGNLGWAEAEMTDYGALNAQLAALVGGVPHRIANLANAATLLYYTLDELNWAGFYLIEGNTLVLGPLQGKACLY